MVMESFRKDLVRRELWPVKVLMFLIYGGQATLYPYFTVHLKSLGVAIEQTAIIFAVQPVIALIVAPMVGMCADRIGNFKYIFSFFLTFSAITANLLLLVPPVEKSKPLQLQVFCDRSMRYTTPWLQATCNITHKDPSATSYNVSAQLFQCTRLCKDQSDYQTRGIYAQNSSNDCAGFCEKDGVKDECLDIKAATIFGLSLTFMNRSTKLSQSDYGASIEVGGVTYKDQMYDSLACSCPELECNTSCTLTVLDSKVVCSDTPKISPFGPTFQIYLGIRLVVTLGIGLVNGLFDAASMTVIQKLHADVGFQRFWSTVAMCMFAPISGYLVDYFDGDFSPCFYMYGVLYIVAAITSLKLDLSMKLPSDDAFTNLFQLLCNPEVVLLLVNVAALGILWGFLENFLFWFLESELHSSNLLMGLTVTVGSGTGLFMALKATWLTRKLGYVNVMVVAFIAYTVRYIGYSYAEDPYICLIYEMMENFTVTLLTVAVTLYCTELASMKMLTTMMTLWNGLHVISGRAFGSLLGGFLMVHMGNRETFRLFAYGSAGFAVLYFLMNQCWLKNWRKLHGKDSESEKRRRSSMSSDKDLEMVLSTTTMHCSFDSPAIVAYKQDSPEPEPRRRAQSHVQATSNSFRRVEVPPRYAHSFSVVPKRQSLPTVVESAHDVESFQEVDLDNFGMPSEGYDNKGGEEDITRF